MRKILLACIALFLPWMASAEVLPDPRLAKADPCGPFEVVHINGILTDQIGAQSNLQRLSGLYGDGHDGHIINYKLAYNNTQGPIGDLAEVFYQKVKEDPTLTFELFLKLITGLITPTELQKKIAADMKRIFDTYELKKPVITDPAVINIAAAIRASLQLPKFKTVVVAHSQGTLYAVTVMERLIQGVGLAHPVPAESISLISIGAAAGEVKGPGASWITSRNDLVINGLRLFSIPVGFNVLPNNVTIPYMASDWMGHNLIGVYLAATVSQKAIVNKMKLALEAVKSPAPPPDGGLSSRAHAYRCGPLPFPQGLGPWICAASIPQGTFLQYFTSGSLIYYNVAEIGPGQIRVGTHGELQFYTKEHMKACYDWWIQDRIAVIESGFGIYYPYHTYGSCGAGYPWQTPYGDPDAAWMLYSADSIATATREWSEGPPSSNYADYTETTMRPSCRRAT